MQFASNWDGPVLQKFLELLRDESDVEWDWHQTRRGERSRNLSTGRQPPPGLDVFFRGLPSHDRSSVSRRQNRSKLSADGHSWSRQRPRPAGSHRGLNGRVQEALLA